LSAAFKWTGYPDQLSFDETEKAASRKKSAAISQATAPFREGLAR